VVEDYLATLMIMRVRTHLQRARATGIIAAPKKAKRYNS